MSQATVDQQQLLAKPANRTKKAYTRNEPTTCTASYPPYK